MFFKKGKKRQRTIRFSDADCIVMETDGMHFELFPHTQTVKYRNVISPRDGGMSFPTGYFDEKVATVPNASKEMISASFDQLFLNQEPEQSLDPLPPGAGRDAYMRVSLSDRTVYYTNTHLASGGFCVEKEPTAVEYIQLIKLLSEFCFFPKYIPEGIQLNLPPELLAKTNKEIESDRCDEYVGYRFDVTGYFGYKFFNAECDLICSVSSIVAPSAPVLINSNTVIWESIFENCTIFPGLSRNVVDKSNDKPIFKLVYKKRGNYTINGTIEVYCDGANYTFYYEDIIIAKVERFRNHSEQLQINPDTEYDYIPYYRVTADNEINKELLKVIFAFPMLKFAF